MIDGWTYRKIRAFHRLFKAFQLDEGWLDTFNEQGRCAEALVEKTLSGIALALEHEEVSVARHLAANGPDGFQIKQLERRADFLLLLVVSIAGRGSHGAAQLGVVDARHELEVDLVLSHVDIVHLSNVVLENAALETDPRFGFENVLLLDDPEDIRHVLDGDHLLSGETNAEACDAFNEPLDVRLFEGFHVDVALESFRRHDRLDEDRFGLVLVRDELAHQVQYGLLFFSLFALDHPQIGVPEVLENKN